MQTIETQGEILDSNVIEAVGLKKAYGQVQAVNEIDLRVKKGEIFSLLGPNGAGKTTTVEMLEGLREKDGGVIKVLGLDPWTNGYSLHKKIGVIPQGFRFFEKETPPEAIRYYADLFGVKADVSEILRAVVLEDASKVWFENLSGGQKQKVGLALALVNDPEVLFLDEPTTGLDPQARRAIWEVITGLKKEGRTVLLTTHYLEEAELLSDRVAIMNKGKIVAEGAPQELISRFGSGERLNVTASPELVDYLQAHTDLSFEIDRGGNISIRINQRGDALKALTAIEESGLAWSELRTERDSLEDIFVRLVGGTLEEHGEIALKKK